MKTAIRLVEKGLVPPSLIRHGIRRLLRERLDEQRSLFEPDRQAALREFVRKTRSADVALVPEKANEQHYEVPPEFFQLVLGERLKYSSAYYPTGKETLAEAEREMLGLTCERAGLADGHEILELGCGWGSLTLWMAEHYPQSRILAVSNSAPQREHILAQVKYRGFQNVAVETCDMNEFDPGRQFDRVVSVEMFEHMRNWEELLTRVSGWLRPEGRLFLHVFAHKSYAYPFEARDESDWMSRYFFTGGMMPSVDLIDSLEVPLDVERRWEVSGRHYARTSEDWLANLEARKERVLQLFASTYGRDQASTWYHRWRVFFLACAELFAYGGGREWVVSHQLLAPRSANAS